MPSTLPITVTNLEEALSLSGEIISRFLEDGIVVLRGINLSEEEQVIFSRALGDEIGWLPNNSSNFKERYQENHASNLRKEEITGDDIALPWHMEHVEYDTYASIVAGVWNMYLYKADPENGKTYFFDSSKVYDGLQEEWKNFLQSCVSVWSKVDGQGPFYTDCVKKHWKTGQSVIRIDVTDTNTRLDLLHTVGGRAPTQEEQSLYTQIRDHFIKEIQTNEENRIVHRWQQGDLVIPDLFKMVHAVTGGFKSEDRDFIGYWIYSTDPAEGRE